MCLCVALVFNVLLRTKQKKRQDNSPLTVIHVGRNDFFIGTNSYLYEPYGVAVRSLKGKGKKVHDKTGIMLFWLGEREREIRG